MISFPNGDLPSDFKARDAIIGFCGAATHGAPRSMQPYLGITGATEALCVGTSTAGNPVNAAVMSWQQGNISALAIGNQFSMAELEQFSVRQDAAFSGSGSGPASAPSTDGSSSGSSNTELFIIVGVVVAVGGAIVFLLIACSRSRTPVPIQALSTPAGTPTRSPFASPPAAARYAPPVAPVVPEPGWQPVGGDPSRIAYWDGTRFTAWRRWDGSAWVD